MDLAEIKREWDYYCKETEADDIVDVDLHYSMAMEVGGLIKEIERLQEELKHSAKIVYRGNLPVAPERDY